jgi:hypothetical protein
MDGVVGRPTKYKEEYAEQARKLCLLGATNEKIADFFEVHISTIYEWQSIHEEFSDALKGGKMLADAEIANSLFHRAKGYSCQDLDIKMYEGNIIETPYIKNYPPDPTSMIFWLKNRQPDLWREKREVVEIDSDSEVTINVVRVSKNKDE